ncbi:LysR family transcriptional regulator [Longispora fulva]|uniref:DNA-binding transcriptional LysR family regulator n=1 Tax=Longispora fulva TaxID=619741 RepID=A0A8J7GJD7_9ACTN|nr:LysR substrate-binding domain-containing protein [Longispora fulva]MBG6138610.1 DNA-binding transcriptional LysR family regulator [Longispora fulva]GIG62283.1 LysR family transcriptional regulator [Longispora fulva]
MQIQSLEVFRAVAAHGSITAAARALRFTQSAVSRQIAALEADTGALLFDRLPRGVALTEEGRCLLAHTGAVLDRLDVARRELATLRDGTGGRLRVGAFATAVAALVPRALAAFRDTHPDVTSSLVEGLTPALLDRLESGDADVSVVSAAPDRPLDRARFELHHLLDEHMLVAVPRTHRLARRRTVRYTELAGESFIAASATPENTLLAGSLPLGFQPRVDFVVGEWTGKLGCVAAGLGVTLIPALAVRAAPADIALIRLHRDEVSVRQVFATTVAGRATPAAVTAFVAQLREVAATL